jgi:hypothetical protein
VEAVTAGGLMNRAVAAFLASTAAPCAGDGKKLGQPLTLKQPMPVSQAVAEAESLVGKTVQVRGKVTEVCQMMGCWMQLVDSATGKAIRIKVNDGEIVFPKDSPSKMVIAEGTMKKIVLTKQQAAASDRHEAEEQWRKFDPATVTTGRTIYQIQGTGAVILD